MISLFTIAERLLFIAAGLGGIGILIFFHELGHFLFCKLFNVYTPTFSIGFGPVLWSKNIGTTKFTLSAIPLGGYVEIAGMGDEQEKTESQLSHTNESLFSKKPYYQKFLIMMGGILFNICFAYKIALLAFLLGAPGSNLLYLETATNTIKRIAPDSLAADYGLEAGDVIVGFNNITLAQSGAPLLHYLKTKPTSVTLEIERNGELISTTEKPQGIILEEGKPLGILLETKALEPLSLTHAITQAFHTTYRWVRDTTYGLIHIVKKADFSSAGGPVKIISMISHSASDGILIYLLFLAIISINLAVFNLLPIPILDGGQLLLVTLETIIGHQLPIRAREYLFIGTWLLFLGLILILSFNDIAQLISPYLASIKQCMALSSSSY